MAITSDEVNWLIKTDISRTSVDRTWPGSAFDLCLVVPTKIQVASYADDLEPEDLWLVFEESPTNGYRVVFDQETGKFGLAVLAKPYCILVSMYDTFTQALRAM